MLSEAISQTILGLDVSKIFQASTIRFLTKKLGEYEDWPPEVRDILADWVNGTYCVHAAKATTGSPGSVGTTARR